MSKRMQTSGADLCSDDRQPPPVLRAARQAAGEAGPDLCVHRGSAAARLPACLSLETSMAEFSWKAGETALLVCFWVTCQISGGLF